MFLCPSSLEEAAICAVRIGVHGHIERWSGQPSLLAVGRESPHEGTCKVGTIRNGTHTVSSHCVSEHPDRCICLAQALEIGQVVVWGISNQRSAAEPLGDVACPLKLCAALDQWHQLSQRAISCG